ncbi:MAG: hypothetical protein R3E08_10480 [Thiotrichaceae bacterium]
MEKNQDIKVTPTKAMFNQEYFELYQYYLASRHQGGGMIIPLQKVL